METVKLFCPVLSLSLVSEGLSSVETVQMVRMDT